MNWFELPEHQWRNSKQAAWSERDFQRQKCYDAESLFLRKLKENNIENEVMSNIEDVQKFVDKICTYVWFRRRWGDIKITVKDGRGRTSACGSYHLKYIKLPCWARSKVVVLHELGHAITPPLTGGGHGRYWARAFLELIEHAFGFEVMRLLRECYKDKRVRYSPKKQLSPEVREAARKRFIVNVIKGERG
ncbi:MAG: hypothetical protein ACTSUP_08065 [Candidatus Heimdallarchaeaceae archaeon]